jgi:hypothetical protein
MFKVNDKVLCYHGPFLYEATVRSLPECHILTQLGAGSGEQVGQRNGGGRPSLQGPL